MSEPAAAQPVPDPELDARSQPEPQPGPDAQPGPEPQPENQRRPDVRPAPRPAPADDEPVLPSQTADDTDTDWRDRDDPNGSDDERYLRERPPHW